MSNKYKYTFFLNNTSKIVITDDSDDIETILTQIKRIIKTKSFSVFRTKTDMVIINPLKIDAIHVSSLSENLKDDKLNINKSEEAEIEIENNTIEYIEDNTITEFETDSNLSNDIDWADDDLPDDIETELDIKSIEDEI